MTTMTQTMLECDLCGKRQENDAAPVCWHCGAATQDRREERRLALTLMLSAGFLTVLTFAFFG